LGHHTKKTNIWMELGGEFQKERNRLTINNKTELGKP